MNLTKAPFDDVEFRRALTTAFDQRRSSTRRSSATSSQASQTGLVLPGQEDWLPEGSRTRAGSPYDPDGRRPGADRRRLRARTPRAGGSARTASRSRSASRCPGGYLDWVAAADILVENLAGARLRGRRRRPRPRPSHDEDRETGNYDMMFGVYGGTCNMYTQLRRPAGQRAHRPDRQEGADATRSAGSDPETDELLGELRGRDRRGRAEGGRRRPGRDHDGRGADIPHLVRRQVVPVQHQERGRLAERGGPLRRQRTTSC